MFGYIEMNNTPPVVRDDEAAVENAECKRRNDEKVLSHDCFPMVAQKRRPSFSRLRVSAG